MTYTAEQYDQMATDLRSAPGTSMLGTHIILPTTKAAAMYEAMVQAAEMIREQHGWKTIETAPIEETIFCYRPMMGRFTGYQSRIKGTSSTVWHNTWSDESGIMPPTHWMPLPRPPYDGDEK